MKEQQNTDNEQQSLLELIRDLVWSIITFGSSPEKEDQLQGLRDRSDSTQNE